MDFESLNILFPSIIEIKQCVCKNHEKIKDIKRHDPVAGIEAFMNNAACIADADDDQEKRAFPGNRF